MTTKMSLAQSDQQARVFVATFRRMGYPNVAVIGPDTSLEIFGVLQPAKWIVIGSKRKIAVSNQGAGGVAQQATDISNEPASDEAPVEGQSPPPSPAPTPAPTPAPAPPPTPAPGGGEGGAG